jgi:aspartate aminotransferase-like enzyme
VGEDAIVMKHRLLTPGPTPVPEETLLELAKPVPYHRTPESRAVLKEVLKGVQYVFQTQNDVIALTSSGTGAMEAALVCAVPRGAKAICAYSGRFGERWHKLWQAFGVESVPVTAPHGKAVSPQQIEEALKAHPDALAVCVVHSETSTGVKHDLAALGPIVAKTPALLIVDAISSAGALELRTDAWNLDLVATGSQKALRMPPGLAFVSVSAKAWKQIEKHRPSAFYFDLSRYRAKLKDPDTPFTPAHTLLRALQVSLRRIRTEGIESIWNHCARLARAARAGVQAMGLELFADPPAEGLTAIKVPNGIDGVELLQRMEKQYGLKLAGGQDQLKGKIVRLAHMGHIDFFDVISALIGLECVLAEMGHPVRLGSAAAAAQQAWLHP